MEASNDRQAVPLLIATAARSYYAEVREATMVRQSAQIERLIDVAFGLLEARKLELRVMEIGHGEGFEASSCPASYWMNVVAC